MFLCWSAKGGSGTTVVAAALSLVLARQQPTVLVDLAGDSPAALGLPQPAGPGVADWLASPTADTAALHRLAVPANDTLQVLPTGTSSPAADGARRAQLAVALAQHPGAVVIDAGTGSPPAELLAAATTHLLVTRPCYLALRRAVADGVQPTGVVLVGEPGRALHARDIERALSAPVVAQVEFDPAVARAVDAGLLAARLPRSLAHALQQLS
jgi:MinD-like ATPase involved in chromosome partitioning or flagellar assembly